MDGVLFYLQASNENNAQNDAILASKRKIIINISEKYFIIINMLFVQFYSTKYLDYFNDEKLRTDGIKTTSI